MAIASIGCGSSTTPPAELEQVLWLIRRIAQSPELRSDEGRGLVEIISRYTQTFLWLQRYDEGLLDDPQGHAGGTLPTPDAAMQALGELKRQLMTRGEATELFANPRSDGLQGMREAAAAIFEYIEVFYNRVRKHSQLGYTSPVQFRNNNPPAAKAE